MAIKLKDNFQSIILQSTGASELTSREIIQNLWSGYGQIIRYGLKGSHLKSVVAKHVNFPDQGNHPRGWNTDLSHQRKVKSYEIEVNWYRDHSNVCDKSCRIPACLAVESHEDEVIIVMEDLDLDAAGFPVRKRSVNLVEVKACLSWLANFHATFLGKKPDGLWKIGTYWHLDTRPDELRELDDKALLNAASLIDQKLNESPFQTFVHGDAKLANFCFSPDGQNVASVDFQYVGGGCGMKDVAYFLGSCLSDEQCARMEIMLLDFYIEALRSAVLTRNIKINFNDLEKNWRKMYPFAWTDFHRFLKGWSPDHWKINGYSERMSKLVISQLKDQN